MNFLAHLHIADACDSDLSGNLLGDFVKGDPGVQFPLDIANGIRLHRFIDSYTDSHPLARQAKQYFPSAHRRFAAIALDMFWDHCLARDWPQYHSLSLEQFCHYCRGQTKPADVVLPARFITVTDAMWRGGWLQSYAEFDNIAYALSRMATRSTRMAPLADTSHFLQQEYTKLSDCFTRLYPDVLEQGRIKAAGMVQSL